LPISAGGGGFLLGTIGATHGGSSVFKSFIIGRGDTTDSTTRLILLAGALMVPNHPAIVSGFEGNFGLFLRCWLVHHDRRLAFFPRREDETRCGVETAGPPPERPEGRAEGEL
jgi:hypothetical protein